MRVVCTNYEGGVQIGAMLRGIPTDELVATRVYGSQPVFCSHSLIPSPTTPRAHSGSCLIAWPLRLDVENGADMPDMSSFDSLH